MKNKGFTLVELLAVIVILAIISIITIPMIGNVIEESKKKSLEQSVNGLVESARYYSIDNDGTYEFLFDENKKGETINGESLDYRGSIDAEGKLYLDNDGNISICVYNDKYYAYKNYNSGIVIGNRSEDNCDIGYDVISNKYIAFLESEGMSSNIYSKDEVNNLIDSVDSKVTTNKNEITNIKSTIETLQNNLNDYALQSSLNETNTNLNNLSSIVSSNQNKMTDLSNELEDTKNKMEKTEYEITTVSNSNYSLDYSYCIVENKIAYCYIYVTITSAYSGWINVGIGFPPPSSKVNKTGTGVYFADGGSSFISRILGDKLYVIGGVTGKIFCTTLVYPVA